MKKLLLFQSNIKIFYKKANIFKIYFVIVNIFTNR